MGIHSKNYNYITNGHPVGLNKQKNICKTCSTKEITTKTPNKSILKNDCSLEKLQLLNCQIVNDQDGIMIFNIFILRFM